MFGMHVACALIFGLLLYDGLIIAVKPGYLDFDNLPETNFSCTNKVIGGYYADVETGCQMFHVCTIGQKAEVTDIKFLCLNGTVFDQETRVCERIDEVDCSKSEQFFNLNLELYGNQAGGIQPEEEFVCDGCDEEIEDDYELTASDVTTGPTTTAVAKSTATSLRPTATSTSSSGEPDEETQQHPYPTSSPETIAALLALHNAFTHSVHHSSKVKPAPPRLINEALSNSNSLSAVGGQKTYFGRPTRTQLPPPPPAEEEEDDELLEQQPPRPHSTTGSPRADLYSPPSRYGHFEPIRQTTQTYYHQPTTPPPFKANYHHFQGKNSGFVHSFDSGKQYNFEYFHPKKMPEAKASVLIVTSTSTSTSSRGPKLNSTVGEDNVAKLGGDDDEFPSTGFDDYPDDAVDDAFFRDVPKVRNKREQLRHLNHRYPDESGPPSASQRFPNHRYNGEGGSPSSDDALPTSSRREEFLQNLLGSLDMDEHDRQKMANFFKIEKEVDSSTSASGALGQLEISLEELIMEDVGKTIQRTKIEERNSSVGLDQLNEMWTRHYQEMSQEVDLNFESGTDRDRRDADRKEKLMKELAEDYALVAGPVESTGLLTRRKRQLDEESRAAPTTGAKKATTRGVPVSEEVDEGDFTTRPYLRPTVRTEINDRLTSSAPVRRRGTRRPLDATRNGDLAKLPSSDVDRRTSPSSTPFRRRPPAITREEPPHRSAAPEVADPLPRQSIDSSSFTTAKTRFRGSVRGSLRSTTSLWEPPPPPTMSPDVVPDPNFDCEGKIKGGFYADTQNDCLGFFICSQGAINGPLLKSHFWCGTSTKFNQRSRTCQAEDLVECAVSHRYVHLNEDFAVPD